MKFFYKTKGAISVFLILIMLPLFTAAVILVDGTRYQSAQTMVQEAGDMAAYSVIANYNLDLKDEFGLFAIDDDNVKSTFDKYFKETLGYSSNASESYSDKVQSFISSSVFGGGAYSDASFLNLYNFNAESSTVTQLYPLSEPGVLQNQIVEYVKYRGIETMLERFEIISKFNELADEYSANKEKAEAIEDLADCDTIYAMPVSTAVKSLKITVDEYNALIDSVKNKVESYENYAIGELCSMAVKDDMLSTVKTTKEDKYEEIKTLQSDIKQKYNSIISQCNSILELANEAKQEYERLKAEYSSQSDICEDIQKEIDILNVITSNTSSRYSVNTLKQISSPDSEFTDKLYPGIDELEEDVDDVYDKYNTEYTQKQTELNADEIMFEIEKNAELKKIRYHIYFKRGGEWSYTAEDYVDKEISDGMANSAQGLITEYDIYLKADNIVNNYKCDFENYYVTKAEETQTSEAKNKVNNDDKFGEKEAKKANEKKKEKDNTKESWVKLDKDIYNNLPSKKQGYDEEVNESNIEDIDGNNAANAISSANSAGEKFLKILESGRNDILTYAYALDTFKTRVTEQGITIDDKPSNVHDRNLVDWRYTEDGEQDLRYRDKKSLNTAFATNEVEYIFAGNRSESTNATVVYSWIYGTRLLNNMIAVYTNKTAKLECEALAAASSALVWGAVPISVFKWIYIAAWAAGETALEMSYLIEDGYRIPLIKTKDTLFIGSFFDIDNAITDRVSLMQKKRTSQNWGDKINVSYEDYLIILMCFVDRNTRLARIADLIQLNMKKRCDSSFDISKSYTYIKAETSVTMKYLFQPISQFTNSYNGTGLRLKNTIYQGY